MDDERENSKKRVSFGKARVRLVHNYYKQNSAENEGADEMASSEIAKIKQPQFHPEKQLKSILKTSTRAVSVDSGLNVLHERLKRTFESGKMDENYWIPGSCSTKGGKAQKSGYTDRKNDLFKTNNKEKDNSEVMATKDIATQDNEAEKPVVKNNEKWEGITASSDPGLASQSLMAIYSGIEADWDQAKQSLSRIGVDVEESRLQNPREFVAIMNMFLSMQKVKSKNQGNGETKQDDIMVHSPTQLPQKTDESNALTQKGTFQNFNNNARFKSTKAVGDHNDPASKEESTNDHLNAADKWEKRPKKQPKNRIKKLKMKGLLPGKKETTNSKMRKQRSYSEDNLDHFSKNSDKAKDTSDSSSNTFERKKSLKPKRSASEDDINHVSKGKVKKTSCSLEGGSSFDTELVCTDTNSATYNESSDAYEHSDSMSLNLSRRSLIDSNLNRGRSSSCPTRKDDSAEKYRKPTKPKIVKRDSWFLIRKQKLKDESPNILKEESIPEEQKGNDLERDFDSKKRNSEQIDTEVSESDIRNERLKPKDKTKSDIKTSENKPTLLTITNQSRSEIDPLWEVNESANNNNAQTKPASGEFEESNRCQKFKARSTRIQKTMPDVECSSTGAINNECLDVATNSRSTEDLNEPNQGDSVVQNLEEEVVEFNSPLPVNNERSDPATNCLQCTEKHADLNQNHPKDQISDEDEFFANQKFQNDIKFIDAEAKRSLRSQEYLKRARKRYLIPPIDCHKPISVLKRIARFGEIVQTTPLNHENSEKKGEDVTGKKYFGEVNISNHEKKKTIRISKSDSKSGNGKIIRISKSNSKFET